jgi:hypothetical protein
MTRIRLLNDEINAVDAEAKARRLVKVWVDAQHAHEIDTVGVRNCSLIADWVIHYINVGVVDYYKLTNSIPIAKVSSSGPGGVQSLPFRHGSRTDVFHLTALGDSDHEVAVLREGATYGLFQAWDGKFQVFPKLNPQNMNPNIFGDGDTVLHRIMNMLTQGDDVGGVTMPTQWHVRTGWMIRASVLRTPPATSSTSLA